MPYVDNAGVRIHYRVEGEGPPLVLVHGLMGTLDDWRIVGYSQILSQEYQLILLDVRGCGGSDKLHESESYNPDLIAGDVVAVLDDSGIDTAHYLGYSMGAFVGFHAIARHAPERFRSLALGGASGTSEVTEGEKQLLAFLAQGIEMAVEQGMPAYIAHWERTMGPLPAERKEQMLGIDPQARLALLNAMFDWPSPESDDILSETTVPCLVYSGDGDPAYETAKESAALMPKGRFVALPGLDHAQAFLRTDLVLPHIRGFLSEVAEG